MLSYSQVDEGNFYPKCIYVAVMLRRMLEAILNADTIDDKVKCSVHCKEESVGVFN